MPDAETTYTQFLHLSSGLRATTEGDGSARFWPYEKNSVLTVTGLPQDRFGEVVTAADLQCIGNEERVWATGYEERFWNPALVPGLGESINDWPGHDWAALSNAHRERGEDVAQRLSSAAGFHLMGASRRLMHISEWYHQMLLYAHLQGFHDNMGFRNSDHTNFLIDCHSFLSEAGSARDHLSAYAGKVIARLSNVGTFSTLQKKKNELPDALRAIVNGAWTDDVGKMTLKHVGRYRDEIIHQQPIAGLSDDFFKTCGFDLGIDRPVLGVKFDIQVWPDRQPETKFDALRSFHAMMRVLYEFGRNVIALAEVVPKQPVLRSGQERVSIREIPTRRVSFP